MALEQKDVELIERVIYKQGDDIAVSVSRSFERLEERIDAAESRIYGRLGDVEDRVDACEHNLTQELESIRHVMSD